jgi:hypothetical protein
MPAPHAVPDDALRLERVRAGKVTRPRKAPTLIARIAVLAALTMSCAIPSHQIEYNAAQNRITKRPRYIGTGDSLVLVVVDSVYGNRYTAKADTSPVVIGERAALFGGADLAKIPAGILSGLVADQSAPQVAPESPAIQKLTKQTAVDPTDQLILQRDLHLMVLRVRCAKVLAAASDYFARNPDESSLIRFYLDADARRLSAEIARDPEVLAAQEILVSHYRARLTAQEFDQLRVKAVSYQRRVAMLAMLVSAAPGFKPDQGALAAQITAMRACLDSADKGGLAMLDEQVASAAKKWRPGRPLPPAGAIVIAGLDIRPLVLPTAQSAEQIRTLIGDLTLIGRNSRQLAQVTNRLAAFAVTETRDTVYVGTWWKPNHLKITPVRGARFADITSPAVAVGVPDVLSKPANPTTPPATPGTLPTQTVGGVNVTITVGTPEKKDEAAPSIPSAELDVLQRNRLHLGVGAMRSGLRTETYFIKPDTSNGVPGNRVSTTGYSRQQHTLVATLGYTLYPFEGKVYGAQAYARSDRSEFAMDYLKQAGLAVFLGLALNDPTKQISVGLETEPFPGLNVGVGRHFGYVPVSQADSTGFVSLTRGEGAPSQWLGANAFVVTIDAATALATFGKLIGLK